MALYRWFFRFLLLMSFANPALANQFMLDFEELQTPQTPAPPPSKPSAGSNIFLPPAQVRPPVRCESGRAIRGEPPGKLWRSLGTMSMQNGDEVSQCNIWHVGGEYNMTNCHCVGRGSISVRFARGSNYRSSKCYSVGCHSRLDYAVVRCPGQTGQVPPVKFASFGIDIGQQVHLLTYDVKYSPDNARFSQGSVIQKVFNADGGAPMQEFSSRAQGGNSGSAVFNKNGEVTCLLHSIASSTVGRSGYARRSYCTDIQTVLDNMSRQGGEVALAREAIRHSQNAIEVAERTCSNANVPATSSTFSASGGIR